MMGADDARDTLVVMFEAKPLTRNAPRYRRPTHG